MLLDNTKNGFTLKSNFELRKAYFLFKIISNKTFTNIGKTALEISLKLRLPILFIVKGTVFEQFCSGESLEESFNTVKRHLNVLLNEAVRFGMEANPMIEIKSKKTKARLHKPFIMSMKYLHQLKHTTNSYIYVV